MLLPVRMGELFFFTDRVINYKHIVMLGDGKNNSDLFSGSGQ